MAASSEALSVSGSKAGMNKLTLVALVIAVAALGFAFLKPGAAPASAPAEPAHAEPKPGPVVDVGQMSLNLADPGRYARVSFALVLAEGTVVGGGGHGGGEGGVEAQFPLVKEAVLFEFSKVSAEQLRAPGGLDAIANTLSERVRGIYEHGEVLRVVLTELLVQ